MVKYHLLMSREPDSHFAALPNPISEPISPEIVRAEQIIEEFRQFLAKNELFQRAVNLESFIGIFNTWFVYFAKSKSDKLNIAACEQTRSISCTGAALLLGIWYEKKFGIPPVYLLAIDSADDIPGLFNHTSAFLPSAPVDPQMALQCGQRVMIGTSDLGGGQRVDYWKDSGMQKSYFPISRHMRSFSHLDFVVQRLKYLVL